LKHVLGSDANAAKNADQVLAMLDRLTDAHPFTEDCASLVRKNVNERDVVVRDAVQFKASLQPSRAAVPVVGYEELAKEPSPEEKPRAILDSTTPQKAVSANL
jgi:putative SOS response-associated peptidase YedK